MGTSKAFSGISGNPNWSDLSRIVTSSCDDGQISKEKLSRITSRFVTLLDGSKIGGRGGSKIGGRAGIRTARRIGNVLSDVKNVGFYQAVANSGYNINSDTTPNEVINYLLEYCSGVASSLDDTAAKEAERQLLEEIATDAKTLADLEKNFTEKVQEFGVEELLIKYYAYYIYEHLSIDFYEKLIKEKGKSKCGNLYNQLKDFLFERVKNISQKKDLSRINWAGEEGDRMVKNIFEDTLKAFEGYED